MDDVLNTKAFGKNDNIGIAISTNDVAKYKKV